MTEGTLSRSLVRSSCYTLYMTSVSVQTYIWLQTSSVGTECLDLRTKMWRILNTVNSQPKAKKRPTFLKDFPDNRAENASFQRLTFPVSGLSFPHSDFSVFLHPQGSRIYIPTRCTPLPCPLSSMRYRILQTWNGYWEPESHWAETLRKAVPVIAVNVLRHRANVLVQRQRSRFECERERFRLPAGSSVILRVFVIFVRHSRQVAGLSYDHILANLF